MVMDSLKEQTLGKFHRKLVDAHCQLKQSEPCSPWKNATEREIKELKKGSGRKMIMSGAPRRLCVTIVNLGIRLLILWTLR